MFKNADIYREDDIVAVNAKEMPVMGELITTALSQMEELKKTIRKLESMSVRLKISAEAVDVLK